MSDDDLRQHFKTQRASDEGRAPAFESTSTKPSAIERRTPQPISHSPRRIWQLSLATIATVIIAVAIQRLSQRPSARLSEADIALLTDGWTVPTDSILTDKLGSALPETTERLTREINQLLKR